MNWLKQLFLRQQLYGDVDKEIAFHLEARIEELVASGMSVKEATATARREFGNVELVKETAREAWGWRWLEDLSGDLRFGVRVMRKNPGFTAVVVLTLALAIGANTAVFTLLNGLVLKSLPVRDPAGLWLVGGGTQCCVNGGVQRKFELFPYPLFLQVRRQKDLFSDLAAFTVVNSTIRIRIGDAPAISAQGKLVSANYFAVLGAEPWLGRGFRPEEESSQQPLPS